MQNYKNQSTDQILTKSFYQRPTELVACQLLGKTLVYQNKKGILLSGIIVETEAYLGLNDPACHSFGGKMTSRSQYLYQDAGYTYVYLIYGMYHCMNFVTVDTKTPEAVLIRSVQPQKGISYMKQNRKDFSKSISVKNKPYIASGPGRLCQAFGFNLSHNRLNLTEKKPYPAVYVLDAKPLLTQQICKSTRIGIQNSGDAALWPLRFYIKDNNFISAL